MGASMNGSVSLVILFIIILFFCFLLALQAIRVWKLEAMIDDLRADRKELLKDVQRYDKALQHADDANVAHTLIEDYRIG